MIGLDEAGYGPLLGPLCLGASVWRVDDDLLGEAEAPFDVDLRAALAGLVCRAGEGQGDEALPVPVDDSKALHGGHDLTGLSRAFGCFAAAMPSSV